MAGKRAASTRIYSMGDASDAAYIITRGPLMADFGDGHQHVIPARNVVVGTLELLLAVRSPRLFDLSLSATGKSARIETDTVREMITGFRFGYNTNIFLAQVLELSNELFVQAEKRSAVPLRNYRRRAELFVKMVDVLLEISERYKMKSIASLAQDFCQHEMYEDGSAYRRTGTLHAVLSPPTARSRFVELFKQNTLVCREGSRGSKMYVLLDGKISVSSGGSYVTTIEQAGEAFGELSLFLDGRRTATLVAEEDSHVYVVEHKNIRQFVRHKSPTLFLCLAEALSARIQQNLHRMHRLNTLCDIGDIVVETGLEPASRDLLGKAELNRLIDIVKIEQQHSPTSVLKAYIEQYGKQITSARIGG